MLIVGDVVFLDQFWMRTLSVNFIHKDLVFFTLKFKSKVNKYILNKGQRSNQ